MESSDSDARFAGIARLYGARGLERLRSSHVAVIGVGGVGSWTVEALARSGVGTLTLIDLDEVCISNVNRQLQALTDTVGRPKIEVLEQRIRLINPACKLHLHQTFFTEITAQELLSESYSFVVDAIDSVPNKCRLIAACRDRGLPLVVCGAAGGRRDGTKIQVADLSRSTHDKLLAEVRSRLRKEFGFPKDTKPFGVPCVFTPESAIIPERESVTCEAGEEATLKGLNCEWGYGAATHVTGAFGFASAGVVLDGIVNA